MSVRRVMRGSCQVMRLRLERTIQFGVGPRDVIVFILAKSHTLTKRMPRVETPETCATTK